MNIQIRGHRTTIIPRWRDHIYTRLSKLDRFYDRIIKLDYVLTSSRHHLKGNEACRITAKVPRKTIAISKKSEDMIGAIDAASKVLEKKVHSLWKDVKIRNRHDKKARSTKRGV